jgi:hypothetical protein
MLITSEESGMGGKSYTVKVYTTASEKNLLRCCNSMLKMVYYAACNSQTSGVLFIECVLRCCNSTLKVMYHAACCALQL